MRLGVNKGFTILEMMMVAVIVAILAGIAIPILGGAKERAYDATVVSDFHRAFNAIEAYFAATLRYPTTPEEAEFVPSKGVIFNTWSVERYDGRPAMHLDASHVNVSHSFHNLGFPYNTVIERDAGTEPEVLALLIPSTGSPRAFDLRASSRDALLGTS